MIAYIALGDSWVRLDQIAGVTRWEVLLTSGTSVPLGDDIEADEIMGRITEALEVKRPKLPVCPRCGLPVGGDLR